MDFTLLDDCFLPSIFSSPLLSLLADYFRVWWENTIEQKRSSTSSYHSLYTPSLHLCPQLVSHSYGWSTHAPHYGQLFIGIKGSNPFGSLEDLALELYVLTLVLSSLLLDLSHQPTNNYLSCIKNNCSLDPIFPSCPSLFLSFIFIIKFFKKWSKLPISNFSPPINSLIYFN